MGQPALGLLSQNPSLLLAGLGPAKPPNHSLSLTGPWARWAPRGPRGHPGVISILVVGIGCCWWLASDVAGGWHGTQGLGTQGLGTQGLGTQPGTQDLGSSKDFTRCARSLMRRAACRAAHATLLTQLAKSLLLQKSLAFAAAVDFSDGSLGPAGKLRQASGGLRRPRPTGSGPGPKTTFSRNA